MKPENRSSPRKLAPDTIISTTPTVSTWTWPSVVFKQSFSNMLKFGESVFGGGGEVRDL